MLPQVLSRINASGVPMADELTGLYPSDRAWERKGKPHPQNGVLDRWPRRAAQTL